jgi:maltose alpha-D-glucosyltransferase / alpha-amylase
MARARRTTLVPPDDQALWYKDAVIYELHVRAFADSDGDGVGDFRGLIDRLDYLQDLGVTALWLLPFYPSPLRDDGYDIAQYKDVNPPYGTLRDFRAVLREAHARGLRVVTELVMNHTSDQHAWFQRSRRARPGTSARDFYVWSDTPDRYTDARIIFKDFETSNWTWDPEARAYYWHRFYHHQPDLNFDNPAVQRAMFDVVDFWLDMGVDGLRLDAVPYLFERDGTNCENLQETLDYLWALRRHVDDRFAARMLLAEANQWPEDAVAYLGQGDICHMAFHFPVMPRMFMATRMEDRFPLIDILAQTPPIADTAQWAMFLRNHDELTLEMVTDEERDYMYRVYAEDPQARINLGIRRRLAPLLGNDRKVIEMMNGLLFSLPGTPVIYYGDEIGMGDNIYLGDRNGVRTPMQWSGDRNAGFSQGNPQRMYLPVIIDPEYHYESVNVEAQHNNPNSLLWWMRRIIALRKRFKAFGRGSLEFLYPDNRKVLAFLRRFEDERILVLANLSRYAQYAELDLSQFRNMVPVELFGHSEFPPIGDLPYFVTLGPHAFYWFSLEPQRALAATEERVPTLRVDGAWDRLLRPPHKRALEEVLPGYLRGQRWFGGKARKIRTVEIAETLPVPPAGPGRSDEDEPAGLLALLRVEYTEGDPDTYVLPLDLASERRTDELRRYHPQTVVAMVRTRDGERALYDALWHPAFGRGLADAIVRRRRVTVGRGRLTATPERALAALRRGQRRWPEPTVLSGEQSNTSLLYGDRFIMKFFRRPEEGRNPDFEVGRFLTERAEFPHVPPVAGTIEYRRDRAEPMTLAILQGFVPNEGDAWSWTLDSLGAYLELVAARRGSRQGEGPERAAMLPDVSMVQMAAMQPPPEVFETVGAYVENARLLGQRTAEMHLALASDGDDPDFAPEPLTTLYQRSLYQSMRSQAARTFRLLRSRPIEDRRVARVMEQEREILDRLGAVLTRKVGGMRIRIHGDYHLGQVLWTGRDFVIIDFEGEPTLPLGERRLKRTPFRDVAGMIRSFHYAAYTALARAGEGPSRDGDRPALEQWVQFWYRWVASQFLHAYLERAAGAAFMPRETAQIEVLLDVTLLHKAVYELRYEANNRPDWIGIPARGVLDLLRHES